MKISSLFLSRKEVFGFDDRWMVVMGIPLIALLVNAILFGHVLYDKAYVTFGGCYFIAVYFTAFFWLVFREINYYLIKKYPGTKDFRKRQMITFASISFTYMLVNYIAEFFLYQVLDYKLSPELVPQVILKIITSLVFSVLILTIYEGIYLSSQLGKSLLEKEMLVKENISSQLAGLRSQINPHFLFNSLNTLSTLIHEDQQRADQFVSKLAKVYRHMLDTKDSSLVPLNEEINYLHAYIHLLKERFGDALVYREHIAESSLQMNIVPLSLQILFENCVKHNVATKEKPLFITISSVENEKTIYVRNNLQLTDKSYSSTQIGLDNIIKRYSFFTETEVMVKKGNDFFEVGLPLLTTKISEIVH